MNLYKNVFHYLTLLLIIILPFHVLLTVFATYKIGIPFFSFYKEVLVVLIGITTFLYYLKFKPKIKLEILDYLILAYFIWLSFITLVNGSFLGLIYGGRLDFLFLGVFLIYRHFRFLLPKTNTFYIDKFILSGGIAIALGFIVRFGLGEQILTNFGFSPNLSKWEFEGAPPIYHGVEGASVRRFQGIFDGPNQTAFFLLTYMGIFLFRYIREKGIEWVIYFSMFIMFGLLLLTYTRSAFVGIFLATGIIGIFSFKLLFTKYRNYLIGISSVGLLLFGLFFMQYSDKLMGIINRPGSTQGHIERMEVGITRFSNNIWGYGLGESGPASRNIHNVNKQTEIYYIPESWYIQQLVEGGFIAFILLSSILGLMTYYLFQYSRIIAFAFICVLGMNIFLHAFESIYINILLFMFIGLFLRQKSS